MSYAKDVKLFMPKKDFTSTSSVAWDLEVFQDRYWQTLFKMMLRMMILLCQFWSNFTMTRLAKSANQIPQIKKIGAVLWQKIIKKPGKMTEVSNARYETSGCCF